MRYRVSWLVPGSCRRERCFRSLAAATPFKTGLANQGIPVVLEDISHETVDSAAQV